MKLGTEDRKKVGALAVLILVAAYFAYSNLSPSYPSAPAAPSTAATERIGEPEIGPAAQAPATARSTAPVRRGAGGRGRGDEFHPVLHSKRPEDRIDPMGIDPTLRLDLLAKLQAVQPESQGRNLFQFGTAPLKAELKGEEPKVVPRKPMGPFPVQPKADPAKPADTPPAPITLKYYGFSTTRASGKRTAFFLDGEDILVAAEGDTVKKRYRVVRIGPSSVLVEDTESKRQQSLPLLEEAAPNAATG